MLFSQNRIVHKCGRFDRVLGGAQKCSDRFFAVFVKSIVLDVAKLIIDHIPLFRRLHVIVIFDPLFAQFIMFPINKSKRLIKISGDKICYASAF